MRFSLEEMMRSSDDAVAKARLTVRPFVLRLAPEATERLASFNFAERGGGDLRLVEKQGRGEWSFEGSGKVHLLARHDPTDVPFEMWTFDVGPDFMACRVDPIVPHTHASLTGNGRVVGFGYSKPVGRVPSALSRLESLPFVPQHAGAMFLRQTRCHAPWDAVEGIVERLRDQTLSGAIASSGTGFRCPLANASPVTLESLVESRVGRGEIMLCTRGVEESRRCACAADAQGFANLRGLYHHLRHKATFDCGHLGANPCHVAIFRALAERVAMARAPIPSELVEDLENDFPRLMEQRRGLIRDDAATGGP